MTSNTNYNGFKGIIKFISTVVSWTALVILIILALFLAYYMIGSRLAAQKGEKFEPIISLYTIISPSMTPNINVWDVVVAKQVNKPEEIKKGDVITFISTSSISRGMTITHRVIEVVEDENGVAYRTKGDNNLSPDTSPAKYDNVIGKVILRIPSLGKVQDLLANKGGCLIAILLPALFIIISDILKVFKLTGVKNKIEQIDKNEKINKKNKMRKEEIRKEILKKRLKINKNENEPDPIKIKKDIRIVVAVNKNNEKETEKTKSKSENTKNNKKIKSTKKSNKKDNL